MGPLLGRPIVVEADSPLVSLDGIHQFDHKPGCCGDVAYLRSTFEKVGRERAEPFLVHVRFSRQRCYQAADELDVAVDVAFELGADQTDLPEDFGAQLLLEYLAVLVFREGPCEPYHQNGENCGAAGRSKDRSRHSVTRDDRKFHWPACRVTPVAALRTVARSA